MLLFFLFFFSRMGTLMSFEGRFTSSPLFLITTSNTILPVCHHRRCNLYQAGAFSLAFPCFSPAQLHG